MKPFRPVLTALDVFVVQIPPLTSAQGTFALIRNPGNITNALGNIVH